MNKELVEALELALHDIDRALESGGARVSDTQAMEGVRLMGERNKKRRVAFDYIADIVRKAGGTVPHLETSYDRSYRTTGRDPDINHSGRG
jgi:hypothetical protein